MSDGQNESCSGQEVIDGGHWTVANLTSCYNALNAEGLLDVAAGCARNLSTTERLKVTRLAQAGHVDQAIGEYLRCALDDEDVTLDMVKDPPYRQVCDEAVWNVFADITYDYVPTPEREAYLERHCAGRPITLPLLRSAWSACQANEKRHERGELLTAKEFNSGHAETFICSLASLLASDGQESALHVRPGCRSSPLSNESKQYGTQAVNEFNGDLSTIRRLVPNDWATCRCPICDL